MVQLESLSRTENTVFDLIFKELKKMEHLPGEMVESSYVVSMDTLLPHLDISRDSAIQALRALDKKALIFLHSEIGRGEEGYLIRISRQGYAILKD